MCMACYSVHLGYDSCVFCLLISVEMTWFSYAGPWRSVATRKQEHPPLLFQTISHHDTSVNSLIRFAQGRVPTFIRWHKGDGSAPVVLVGATMTAKVSWQSVKWPDGCTYEGLVKGEECHVRGVFKYNAGDRYEGEYQDNKMDGFGVYVWRDGTIYRGQWQNNMMHGCGVKISKQPNGDFIAEEGQFVNDEWVGDVMACTVDQARAAAAESDIAAQMARVFELRDDKAAAPFRAAAPQPASLSHASSTISSRGPAHSRGRRRQGQEPSLEAPQRGPAAGGQQSLSATRAAAAARAEVPAAAAPAAMGGRGGPLGFLSGLLRRS